MSNEMELFNIENINELNKECLEGLILMTINYANNIVKNSKSAEETKNKNLELAQKVADIIFNAIEKGSNDGDKYKCPICNQISSKEKWNYVSFDYYDYPYTSIEDDGMFNAYYVCPICNTKDISGIEISKNI
jgi:rubrerythrin